VPTDTEKDKNLPPGDEDRLTFRQRQFMSSIKRSKKIDNKKREKKRIKQKNYSFEGIKEGESYINFRRRIGKETVKKNTWF